MWLRRRLYAVGGGVRNLLVDASNYVLFEVGQPNHAFDQRRLTGNEIRARLASQGENFLALDGIERKLSCEDVVLSDANGPLDLAGVIGGKGFSVEDDTTSVLLLSSCFDPVKIRKTCKRNQVRTNSSNLYEKSLSPYQVPMAPIRYVEILKKAGQQPLLPYSAYDCFPNPPKPIFISYSNSYIRERLEGKPDTDLEIKQILERLNFEFEDSKVKVPYYRATKDISIVEDLVEEVGRTIGYENIPEAAPLILSTGSKRGIIQNAERGARALLCGMGFVEVYNYTFSSKELGESLGYDLTSAVEVQNPVDKNLKIVQVSLIPNLIDVAVRNLKVEKSVAGFEIGRSYHSLPGAGKLGNEVLDPTDHYDSAVRERRLLGLFLSGARAEKKTFSEPEILNGQVFYTMKESIVRLAKELSGQDVEFKRVRGSGVKVSVAEDYQTLKPWMHPGRSACIWVGGVCLGLISEVRPSTMSLTGINNVNDRVVVAEIDIEALIATKVKPKKFLEFSKFPDSFFEVSLVMKKDVQFDEVCASISERFKEKEYLKEIKPVSVFEGEPLKIGTKSLSLQFVFSKEEDTLSSEELFNLREAVIKSATDSGYSLR